MNIQFINKKQKMSFIFKLAFLVSICLSICFVSFVSAQEETIKIGCSIALTGALSREGQLGRDGYNLWMDTVNDQGGLEVNGKRYKIEIVYYDDRSEPQTSARLAEKLISDEGIKLIFGPFSSGVTFPVSDITERYGALLMSAMGNADMLYDRGYKNIFSITQTPYTFMRPVLDLLSRQSPKPSTISILTKDELFSLTLAEGARDYATEIDMEVVYFAKYPAGLQDLSTHISQMKALNPDIFIATGHIVDSLLIVRQSKELGFRTKAWDIQVGPELPEFKEVLGKDANYTMYYTFYSDSEDINWKDPVFDDTNNWKRMFEEKYGYKPNQTNGQACSTGVVLGEAIKKVGSIDPIEVRDALIEMEIETFFGPVNFDERGVNTAQGIYIYQIQPEKDVIVYPEIFADGELLYPMPRW